MGDNSRDYKGPDCWGLGFFLLFLSLLEFCLSQRSHHDWYLRRTKEVATGRVWLATLLAGGFSWRDRSTSRIGLGKRGLGAAPASLALSGLEEAGGVAVLGGAEGWVHCCRWSPALSSFFCCGLTSPCLAGCWLFLERRIVFTSCIWHDRKIILFCSDWKAVNWWCLENRSSSCNFCWGKVVLNFWVDASGFLIHQEAKAGWTKIMGL